MKFFLPAIGLISALNLTGLTACNDTPRKPTITSTSILDPKHEALLDSARNSNHFIEVEMPVKIMQGTRLKLVDVYYIDKAVLLILEDSSHYLRKCKDARECETIYLRKDSNYCFDKCLAELVYCPENKAEHK